MIASGNHNHQYKTIALDTGCSLSLTRKLSVLCKGTMDSKIHWSGRSTHKITRSSDTRNTLLAGILCTMLFAKWILATLPRVVSKFALKDRYTLKEQLVTLIEHSVEYFI